MKTLIVLSKKGHTHVVPVGFTKVITIQLVSANSMIIHTIGSIFEYFGSSSL